MARLCYALETLRGEINAVYPHRDKTSDGWIGNAEHASRISDHNPNAAGVVRAIDVDKDGVPAASLVELIRQIGKTGDVRLVGGYVIFMRRIAGTHTGWSWHQYTGTNPHDHHFHVSAATSASGYDRKTPWGIKPIARRKDRWLGLENPPLVGADVAGVQRALNLCGNHLRISGVYDQATANLIHVFQVHRNIKERGVGPKTWAQLRAVPGVH